MTGWLATRAGRLTLLLVLAVVALTVRLSTRSEVLQGGGVMLSDLDTMRRLARIEALDAADSYPVVEVRDGHPTGTTLHWTLPMDLAIRTLDPLLGWLVPGEKGYEGGAVLAGPVLATAAVVGFTLLLTPLLGAAGALAAGLFYALGRAFVATSQFGNGDHQTLQQLAAVIAVLGLLRALAAGDAGRRWALASGAALGFSVWVSTELMLLAYALMLALVILAAWPWRDPVVDRTMRTLPLPWGAAAFGVALLGQLAEHRTLAPSLHWDVISGFQLWQFAGFVAFAAVLARGAARPGVVPVLTAAGVALLCGLLPFVSGDVRAAFAAQLQNAGEVNVWLKQEVSEFRSVFREGFGHFLEREGWLWLAAPFALLGLLWSPWPATRRMFLGAIALATFALYAYEVKLGHLWALTAPVLLVAGAVGLAHRLGRSNPGWFWAGSALAAWSLVAHLPGPRAQILRINDAMAREIGQKIAALQGERRGGVLAPWDMGARLMYEQQLGVVATGYHRNLEGIRDGFRFYLTDIDQREQAMAILKRRDVRWVVAWQDRLFLDGGARTIGLAPLRTDRDVLPAAKRTMFWKLRYETVPGFRLVANGPEIRRSASEPPEPLYRIYEVLP